MGVKTLKCEVECRTERLRVQLKSLLLIIATSLTMLPFSSRLLHRERWNEFINMPKIVSSWRFPSAVLPGTPLLRSRTLLTVFPLRQWHLLKLTFWLPWIHHIDGENLESQSLNCALKISRNTKRLLILKGTQWSVFSLYVTYIGLCVCVQAIYQRLSLQSKLKPIWYWWRGCRSVFCLKNTQSSWGWSCWW